MREHIGVDDGVGAEHLDEGVVPDAGHHYADVEDGQGHQQRVEVGAHLWLPGEKTAALVNRYISDNVVINNHHLLPANTPMIAMETVKSEISLKNVIFLDSRQDTEIITPGVVFKGLFFFLLLGCKPNFFS